MFSRYVIDFILSHYRELESVRELEKVQKKAQILKYSTRSEVIS